MAIKLIINRRGVPFEERTFDAEIVTIGSDPSCTLCLSGGGVAPEQAALILDEEGRLLFINRADGTLLNDEPLAREALRPLADGDTFHIGPYSLRLSLNHGGPAAPSPAEGQGTTPLQRQAPRQAPAPDDYAAPATQREAQLPPPPPPPPAAHGQSAHGKSFASILDSLRTEEDSFYFQVETAGGRRRVPVEGAEMMIGWDETGQRISCEALRVVAPRALVRKGWSGVVVLPLNAGTLSVSVNGEPVETARRLRNGDRLTLLPTAVAADPEQNFLVFHEPASLVVLDSLLPQQLPPPVAPAPPPAPADAPAAETSEALAPVAPAALERKRSGFFAPDRRYIRGYFTPTEILIMVCGTLVTAVVIFLILEYS